MDEILTALEAAIAAGDMEAAASACAQLREAMAGGGGAMESAAAEEGEKKDDETMARLAAVEASLTALSAGARPATRHSAASAGQSGLFQRMSAEFQRMSADVKRQATEAKRDTIDALAVQNADLNIAPDTVRDYRASADVDGFRRFTSALRRQAAIDARGDSSGARQGKGGKVVSLSSVEQKAAARFGVDPTKMAAYKAGNVAGGEVE